MNNQPAAERALRVRWWRSRSRRRLGTFRGSLALRLVVFSIVLVSLTAMLIGSLAYERARRALEKEARVRLALAARSVAKLLHRELEDRVADIMNWTHLEVMRAVLYEDVDKQLAEFMRQIVQGRPIYRALLCLGADGRPVASAGDVQAVVSQARASLTRISIVPAGRGSNDRVLRIDTPVFNPDHSDITIGTLVVILDPVRLLNAVDAPLRTAGAPASLTLRSRAGEVLSQSGWSPSSGGTERLEQDMPLTGAAAVDRLSSVDGPELQVVVTEPAALALTAVAELRSTLLKVAIFVLALSSVLGALVAWRIGLPIRRLTTTVREITQRGQLDPAVEFPHVGGEVGVLAGAFRTMLESVAAAQAETVVQSRLALLGEVAANVAHEVRTPLSALKTSAQLLARPDLPIVEQQKLVRTVTAEVDRLNRVVTDLVDLARPKPMRYRDESIVEIIARAVAFFGPLATKSGIEVRHTVGKDVPRVHCSADQLYQVFLNLIQNALQAMKQPGCVTIRCSQENEWVVVEVEDTGPGFSAEVVSRLFSPFATTKPNGTGLGLAISRRIVEEHGGTIVAESPAGGGALFRIQLPAKDECI